MKIAQAKRLYIISTSTFGKLQHMMCNRCGEGFDIGQEVLTRSKKAHSRYGVYHKKCALEVNLL